MEVASKRPPGFQVGVLGSPGRGRAGKGILQSHGVLAAKVGMETCRNPLKILPTTSGANRMPTTKATVDLGVRPGKSSSRNRVGDDDNKLNK